MFRENRKFILAALILAAMLCVLGGCKKGEKAAAPESYPVGEESVPAFFTADGVFAGEELTETGGTYTYEELAEPGMTTETYAQLLISEENGYSAVDDENTTTDLPDFTAAEGTVKFAKSSAQEGKLLSVSVSWAEGTCAITVDLVDGQVQEPQSEGMTQIELVDFVKSLDPKTLGLEGSSMEDYEVYVMDGAVLVDDRSCAKVSVCDRNSPEGTNKIAGEYFVSADGAHIYHFDSENEKVTEVEIR